ncbi:MAG: hypothetical protein ACOX3K_00125 [Bacilli bacterium]|jgi:hypothetical protein
MSNLVRIIVAIAIVGGLFALFLLGFLLNKKTKKPEGCEDLSAHCQSCQIEGCAVRQTPYEEKQEGEQE